jgi:hypothetical protein
MKMSASSFVRKDYLSPRNVFAVEELRWCLNIECRTKYIAATVAFCILRSVFIGRNPIKNRPTESLFVLSASLLLMVPLPPSARESERLAEIFQTVACLSYRYTHSLVETVIAFAAVNKPLLLLDMDCHNAELTLCTIFSNSPVVPQFHITSLWTVVYSLFILHRIPTLPMPPPSRA